MTQTTNAARYQRDFEAEKAAFERLHASLRDQYDGMFVAVHRGHVVDSDPDLQSLVSRFFSEYGDVSVYVGYVGSQPPIRRISSPSVQL